MRGDGAGAGGAVGGRLRVDRAGAARRGDDRPGPPGRPRRTASASSSRCSGRPRESDIMRDLGLLELFAEKTANRPALRKIVDIPAAIEHLSDSLRRELDFRQEAQNIERMRAVARRLPAARRSARLRGALDEPAARARGDRRAFRCARSPKGPRAARPPGSCSRLLPPDPRRRLLPRRPAPREPALVERAHLLPRLRHGRRARAGDARASSCSCCSRSGRRTCPSSPRSS